jgi:hypothetical protein
MKKISLFIAMTLLVIGIGACESNIVEIPIETEEPVVPVEREPDTNGVDSSPEVIVEFVDRFITVPANVERQRRYLSGTYMLSESRSNEQSGYVFSVVVIDDFGYIAGVYIDQTLSTRNLFRSPSGTFYAFVRGNRVNIPDAYRVIELKTPFESYPTTNDAIRTTDLVVGIDDEAIRQLVRIPVNETKQLAASRVATTGALNYQQQMQAVAQKIVDDNTTYGINFIEKNGVMTASNVEGVTEALDVPLFLVQSILDGPAALPEDATLRSLSQPRYGVYETGIYTTFSPLSYVDEGLVHGFSIVVVDDFGRMIGVYLDEIVASTARSSVVASKQILKTAVGLSATQTLEWFEQANMVANQIVSNQGIQGITLATPTEVVDEVLAGQAPLRITNMSNITIRANEILLATKDNLTQAMVTDYVDGTYITSNASTFTYVTIQDQQIVDVYVDRFVLREQAQVFRRGQASNVERIVRQFSTPTGNVSADVLVYSIGESYYSVHRVSQVNNIVLPANQIISIDQAIVLTEEELATKRPVPGMHTASSLRRVDAAQDTWVTDQQQLANAIGNKGTITDFQVVNGRIPSLTSIPQLQVANVLGLVAEGLYQARQVTRSGLSVPFIAQATPLANGSYVSHSAPDVNGAIHFTYMVVKDGVIITWIVDSTLLVDDTLQSVMVSSLPQKQELIQFSNALRESQTTMLYSLIVSPAPNPTIQSIQSIDLRDPDNAPLRFDAHYTVLDDVIRQATEAKQTQDIRWIRDYFNNSESYFKSKTLIEQQTTSNWLPSSITDPALSDSYRLEWRTSERALSLTLLGQSYSAFVSRLDASSNAFIELEIYRPGQNFAISRQVFELPMRQRTVFGTTLLNSQAFDLPSNTLLAGTQFTLPNSNELAVSWQSTRPQVMSAAGLTANVSQATSVDMIAYIDLDGNGELGPNEPSRTYTLTILPLPLALTRLRAELDTNTIGEFIGNQVTLGTASSVWGLSYTWSVNNQNATLIETAEATQLFIRSLDASQTIQVTATINVPNSDISTTYKVDTGNKRQYTEFAAMDLPAMNTDSALIQGESIFADDATQGAFYRSQIRFYTTDFGRFINAQGDVIYQHPTIDACFEAVVTSTFSGGVVDASVSASHPFCVMSLKTLQDQMNEDRDQLQDYVIDLALKSHVDTPLRLPLQGWVHQHPIRWEIVEGQEELLDYVELSGLSSGLVVMKTSTSDIPVGFSLRLTAVIDVTAGTPPVAATKEVTIEVLGE